MKFTKPKPKPKLGDLVMITTDTKRKGDLAWVGPPCGKETGYDHDLMLTFFDGEKGGYSPGEFKIITKEEIAEEIEKLQKIYRYLSTKKE